MISAGAYSGRRTGATWTKRLAYAWNIESSGILWSLEVSNGRFQRRWYTLRQLADSDNCRKKLKSWIRRSWIWSTDNSLQRTNEVYLPVNEVNNDWLPVEAEAHQSRPPNNTMLRERAPTTLVSHCPHCVSILGPAVVPTIQNDSFLDYYKIVPDWCV